MIIAKWNPEKGAYAYIGSSESYSPNLLINPDFRINQRGEASYTTGYTVDRWKTSNLTVAVTADGLQLDQTDSSKAGQLIQYIEADYSELAGRDVTVSITVADGTTLSATGTVPDTAPTADTLIARAQSANTNYKADFHATSTGYYVAIRITGSSPVIKNIKLEVGVVATPFSPPEFGTELMKCQRYYCRIATSNRAWAHYGSAFATSDSVAFIVLQLPTAMRPNRAVEWGGNHRLYKASGSFTAAVTAVTAAGRKFDTDDKIALYVNADGLTADENYLFSVQNDSSAYLSIDAEIY